MKLLRQEWGKRKYEGLLGPFHVLNRKGNEMEENHDRVVTIVSVDLLVNKGPEFQ